MQKSDPKCSQTSPTITSFEPNKKSSFEPNPTRKIVRIYEKQTLKIWFWIDQGQYFVGKFYFKRKRWPKPNKKTRIVTVPTNDTDDATGAKFQFLYDPCEAVPKSCCTITEWCFPEPWFVRHINFIAFVYFLANLTGCMEQSALFLSFVICSFCHTNASSVCLGWKQNSVTNIWGGARVAPHPMRFVISLDKTTLSN